MRRLFRKCSKDICESINLGYSHNKKCVFEYNKCVEKERKCSEFKIGFEAITNCYTLHANDENKLCIFKSNKCEEQYKKCDDYKEDIKKDICESIQPYVDYEGFAFDQKCAYENGKCVQKDRICSEYNYELGIYRYICEQLNPSDQSKKCALVNNKCIEQFIDCEDYKGKDKDICESIEPSNKANKCVLEGDSCVSKKKTSCSDYKPGSDEDLCSYIQLEDLSKACIFFNNECIETYKTCEDYQGDNIKKEICESIYTTREKKRIHSLDYESKCIFDSDNKKCKTQIRNCSDSFLDIKGEFCDNLNVVDKKKICLDYNDHCIETYRTCEDYNENVEKSKCELIIPENYYSVKCVYDSDNRKCISENLECSSFKLENLKYYCDILGKKINKICTYSDGFCLEKNQSDTFDDTDEEKNDYNNYRRFDISKTSMLILYLLF